MLGSVDFNINGANVLKNVIIREQWLLVNNKILGTILLQSHVSDKDKQNDFAPD